MRWNAPGRRTLVARPGHETGLGLFGLRPLPGLRVLLELGEITWVLRWLRSQQERAPLDLDVVDLFAKLAQPDRRDQAPGSEEVAVDDQMGHGTTVPPKRPVLQAERHGGAASLTVVDRFP